MQIPKSIETITMPIVELVLFDLRGPGIQAKNPA